MKNLKFPPRNALGPNEIKSINKVISYYKKVKSDPAYEGIFEKKLCKQFSKMMGGGYADACSSHDEEVITAFNTIKEEYNRTNFETVHVIHNYYNRLIAYEGRTPHRAGCYFGTDFEDSRLTLTFFYDTK